MKGFNELNSVEHFVIQRLSGLNLNQSPVRGVAEDGAVYNAKWQYIAPEALPRDVTEVLLETELTKALIRLNPDIAAQPTHAEEVIRKLRSVLITVSNVGLVRANENFATWLRNEQSLPFGKGGKHSTVTLIDYDNLENNSYLITNQFRIHARETKIPDIVLFINGIPVVVGEVKTAVRPAISWYDAAHDIHEVYENSVPQLFVPNILSFASEGKQLFIGAIRTPLEFWSPWRIEEKPDALRQTVNLQDVGQQLTHLFTPAILLDILRYYTVYGTNNAKKKIKVICRYQQYEGANAIVRRVLEGNIKKGLIWHFQGSGKSLLMLFAARKLRQQAALKNPTVLIVVDRTDLDTQITTSFGAADVKNFVTTDNIKELHQLLEKDSRKIIITMIQKFREATPNMNTRDNIIVLVDEAHRTQEGNLGQQMRSALPNAFLFGLTGTPINKADKNTFWAFGADEDAGGYLSRYTFQDSIRDKATLPLHFEPRLPNYHIDSVNLDIAFREMANDLDEDERNKLSKMAAKMGVFLKSPERIAAITADIVVHFKEYVAPQGFKAMIVTPDRFACIEYKKALDQLLPETFSKVVISTSANDEADFKQQWGTDKEQQGKIVEAFNDKNDPLQFLIVTAKLLTGFDAPILQTMYLDKSLKDHTLLQAICRTNRLFPNKTFGRIVDYFGIFDDTAKAIGFDEETMKTVISNLQELRNQLPEYVTKSLQHFEGIDRNVAGFEGLEAAQEAINTDEKRDVFAADFSVLAKIWEALSPDEVLNPYKKDYRWLSQVYESVRPSSASDGKLLWHRLGARTTALIHAHLHVEGINTELETMVLNESIIEELMNKKNPKEAERITKLLISRFRGQPNNPAFKALSERLKALQEKAEKGLISSVEYIKQLCELATDTLDAERAYKTAEERKTATSALTELFLEMKTEETPVIIERIVTDIDRIVKEVRYDDWQNTLKGERTVKKALRDALLKYALHKETALFERAYAYIKAYY